MMRACIFIVMTLSCWSLWANDPLGDNAGEALFQQKCAACHTVGEGNRVGPDLLDVAKKRQGDWLVRWIAQPDQMLAEKDPIAMDLLKQFNQIPMPNLGVTEAEAKSLIQYITKVSETAAAKSQTDPAATAGSPSSSLQSWWGTTQFAAFVLFIAISLVIAFVFWRVAVSTRQPMATIDMKSAYALRKKLFIGSTVVVLGTLGATLPFTPYSDEIRVPDQLVYVAAKQFGFVYSSEPITSDEDFGRVPAINSLQIPVGALVEFRVTSLDVTHGFAIYGPDGSVVAQTQAMPGYINRLRLRFPAPGNYNVLCLEYCGLAHHLMRTTFVVQ